MPCLQPQGDGVILRVLVQPRSSRNQVVGLQGEELKLRLTSPPVDGAANKLCTQFIAKLFGIPRRDVELLTGDTSRHKRLWLHGVDEIHARQVLAEFLDA